MKNSRSANTDTTHTTKQRWRWLVHSFILLAIVALVIFAWQWSGHNRSGQVATPAGTAGAHLKPADRIRLQPAVAADCNVLVVTMDTTRADHIGCYGHRSIKTPVIDRLARDGVLFAKAITPAPSTLPGHASIFTGLYPYHHGARANGSYRLGPQNTTLAEILKSNGYATGAFISAYVLDSRFGLDQGFDLYDDDLSKGAKHAGHSFRERPAKFVNDAALRWLKTVADRKFFAWVHYFDPHAPYVPPEPYRTQYQSNPYDGEIAYVDRAIGMLLSELGKLDVLKNTVVIIASDHGEGLGEHGEQTHGLLVYDSTIHTPLIIWPATGEIPSLGHVVDRQVSNVDIMPTILDLLGIQTDGSIDGVSLLRGPEAHASEVYVESIATLVHYGWSPLFAVRQQKSKYIHAPRPELYDLENDPKELNNLFLERPEQSAALSQVLDDHIGDDVFGADALGQRIAMDAESIEMLSGLGYVGSATGRDVDASQASKLDPKDMVPHYERVKHADHQLSIGRFKQAVAELETCLKDVPGDVWATRLLTIAYMAQGDLNRAEQMANRVIELDPNDPRAQYGAGRRQEAARPARSCRAVVPQGAGGGPEPGRGLCLAGQTLCPDSRAG